MAEPKYIEGKKPDREIRADEIGKLEVVSEEAGGRTSPFWIKCWSCHKYLARPLSPPSQQEAYICPNCGAVNMI
jgi:hypothetical protein